MSSANRSNPDLGSLKIQTSPAPLFIVYEPQCVGPEHVEFNSALIETVTRAFPSARVVFCAEASHLSLVRRRLLVARGSTDPVRFVAVKVPARLGHPARRLAFELQAFATRLLRFSARTGARGLLFSSMTAEGLIGLKIALYLNAPSGKSIPIGVVLHAVLESLVQRPRRNPMMRLLSIRNALRFPTARPDLRYVVLSKLFADETRTLLPELAQSLISIEHPYFFPLVPESMPRPPQRPVVFGTVGGAKLSKGYGAWGPLARDVQAAVGTEGASFVHIGVVYDPILFEAFPPVRFVTAKGWTKREDYERELAGLDYAVFLYPKDSYLLTASGALMDALCFARPVVALRNPYFEHCFSLLGDIGYLCNSIEEMRALMVSLVKDPPADRFLQQQDNIFKGRARLCPQEIAPSFSDQWTEFSELVSARERVRRGLAKGASQRRSNK